LKQQSTPRSSIVPAMLLALLAMLLAVLGCGDPEGVTSGEVSVEAHCGKSGAGGGCRCNAYCRNTGCGLCRAAAAGLVAEPPAQGQTACVNGFAGSYPCHNVDLMAFLPAMTSGAGPIPSPARSTP
jgi:hypothetical protein